MGSSSGQPIPSRRPGQPLLKRPGRLAPPWSARICYLLAVLLLLLEWKVRVGDPYRWELFPLMLILLLVGAILQACNVLWVQRRRNRFAHLLDEQVRRGEYQGGFSLYLRPFASTGRVRLPNPRRISGVSFLATFFEPRHLELERVLSDALAMQGPLIALGKPGEHLGAGRLPADEKEWQQIVARLASAARAILVLPSHHPGTLWEISWLKQNGLFSRCVFLMPPGYALGPESSPELWRQAAAALARIGILLPAHSPAGALFTLTIRGFPCNREPLDLTNEKGLRTAFGRLLEAGSCARPPAAPPVIYL